MTPLSTAAEKMIRRVGTMLGGASMSRRGFFARTAVVGSALVIDPVGFTIKPVSAYGSVCGDAANCNDGFSVFCCTINNGGNFCPDGTFLGGWWKADNSGFCCGGPRYYLDCNVSCGPTNWSCHCEDSPTTCDHRHVACNQFRYGQCHTEIDCYGPVACRLVTCTPPWAFDPSCNSSVAVDESTVTHTAPCLPGDCPSALVLRYYDLGGPGGSLGPQVGAETTITGGTWLQLTNGGIFEVYPIGMHTTEGPIFQRMMSLGGPSKVGAPTQDDATTTDGTGRWNIFQRFSPGPFLTTSIYWSPVVGSGSVSGPIRDHWIALNYENGPLGYPVSDTLRTSDRTSTYTNFAKVVGGAVVSRGAIYSSPTTGTRAVWGPVYDHWKSLGYENGSLGYPTSDVQPTTGGVGHFVSFTKTATGSISNSGSRIYTNQVAGTRAITGAIYTKFASMNYELGALGVPLTDPQRTADKLATFSLVAPVHGKVLGTTSALYSHTTLGTWAILGPVYATWASLGGPTSPLGYPTADALTAKVAGITYSSQAFQHGSIYDSPLGHGAALWGTLLAAYLTAGGPTGAYGLPTGSQTRSGTSWTATFQHGTLTVAA